jgi:hypothetical protein
MANRETKAYHFVENKKDDAKDFDVAQHFGTIPAILLAEPF